MAVWIRGVALGLGLFALTGCDVPLGGLTTTRISVLDGAMTVAAPNGYCVDPQDTRQSGDTAVVLIGRCSETSDALPALLTVSVGPAASAGAMTAGGPALAAFFTSPEGRTVLSREGRASDVKIIQALGVGDAFLMYLSDKSVGTYWRAVTGMNGRLVTVSAAGSEGAPLSSADGRKLLDAALAAMRNANPKRAVQS